MVPVFLLRLVIHYIDLLVCTFRVQMLTRFSLPSRRNYSINQRQLFDENYALAATQSLKNKDIPEGGAKGTILPSLGANPRVAFEKYVDVSLMMMFAMSGHK